MGDAAYYPHGGTGAPLAELPEDPEEWGKEDAPKPVVDAITLAAGAFCGFVGGVGVGCFSKYGTD